MTEIHATKGKVFIVDDEFAYLAKYKWQTRRSGQSFYAARSTKPYLYLHHAIVGVGTSQKVDHKNGNTFDCRRTNLRVCTQRQNCQNRSLRKDNRLRVKGVRMRESIFSGQRFPATIFYNGTSHALGTFNTAEEAAQAYDEAAIKHFGEFAKTNEGMQK